MALKFNDVNGEAKKSNADYLKFVDGENKFRLVGEVLPRYVYWKKTPDGSKTMFVECLSFDRDQEKFTNVEKDYFAEMFPEDKCSWAYVVQAIDRTDGKLKVVALKKKMFEQVVDVAHKHKGDPTDYDTGWDIVVERKKTGPLPFNVEYTLDVLSLENSALTDEEKEMLEENLKPIEELFPRQTPEEQKAYIDKVWGNASPEEDEDDDNDNNDDIPD